MRILERLISIFDGRRRTLLGAVGQPNDITSYLYKIRADTYRRLTGKTLPQINNPSLRNTDSYSSDNYNSVVGRLRRRKAE